MKKTTITSEIIEIFEKNYINEYGIVAQLQKKVEEQKNLKISRTPIKNWILKNKLSDQSDKRIRKWEKDELEILQKYIGVLPFDAVVSKIQGLNKKNKKHLRTKKAIQEQYLLMGLSARVDGIYYTIRQLSICLGCSQDKINYWLKDKKIKEFLNPQKNGINRLIHVNNIKKFIIKYRQEIANLKPDLEWILNLFADNY